MEVEVEVEVEGHAESKGTIMEWLVAGRDVPLHIVQGFTLALQP